MKKKLGSFLLSALIALTVIIIPFTPASARDRTITLEDYVTEKIYSTTATLKKSDNIDHYYFTAPISGTYTIETKDAAFDSFGILNNITTNDKHENNSGGTKKNFLIKQHLNKGDSCKLTVKSFAIGNENRQYGTYTLQITMVEN